MKGNHRFIKHTADIGLEANASELVDLFNQILEGFREIYFDQIPSLKELEQVIKVWEFQGINITEDLVVDFINEVIFSLETENWLVLNVNNIKQNSNKYIIKIIGTKLTKQFKIGLPIKAATYHQLYLRTDPDYFIRLIFDV